MKKIILTFCFFTLFFTFNIISLKAQYIVKPGDSSDNYNIVNVYQASSFLFPSSNTTLLFPIIGCANDSIFTISTTGYSVQYSMNDLYQYTTYINIIDTTFEVGIDTIINNVHFSTIIPYLNLPNSFLLDSNTSNHWVNNGIVQLYDFYTYGSGTFYDEYYLPIRKKIGNSYFYGWIFYSYHNLGGGFTLTVNTFSEFKKIKIFNDSISCNSTYTFANGVTLNNLYHDTTYSFNTPSSNVGCDSLVKTELKVNLSGLVSNYDTICIGTNYTFIDGSNSTIIQKPTFVHHNVYSAQNGCDSIIETILHVKGSNDSLFINLNCGSSYLFPDNSFVPQIFNDTVQTSYFINFEGCDSIINTKLKIMPKLGPTEFEYICKGASYTFPDGITISNITSNLSHLNHLIASNGCDSVFTTYLSVNNPSSNTINQISCNSYTFNNQTLTTNGIYYDTLLNANGCDSVIITLNLTINNSTSNTINQISCNSYTFNNQTLTTSGIYYDTLINTTGCDSIIMLNLTINYPTSNTINQTSCNSYTFNNQTLTTSGIYYDTLINSTGCDSIITLNLTINNSTSNAINQTSCNSFTFNNQTLTQSGTYYDTLINSTGCDSIITLNLTINNSTSNTINQTTCNSYLFNNQTLSQSGTYYDTLINSTGCDSIITLNLTINNVNSTSTQNGTQLSASASGATYQWLTCNPFTIIAGETNQLFAATTNGDYAVAVTQNGCTDTSNCMTVNSVGINEQNTKNLITISPNPTHSIFKIECPMNGANVILYNSFGQKLLTSKIENQTSLIDMSHFSKGIYIAEIIDDKTSYRVKIIKD